MALSQRIHLARAALPRASGRIGRFQAGFVLACACGVLGLAAISFAPTDSIAATVVLLLLPLAIGLLLTGRLTDALTLVWIDEMLFGGSGHWLQLGPLSIRWLLLLALIVLGAAQALLHRPGGVSATRRKPAFAKAIVFYGALLPAWLVSYSVLVRATPFWTSVGDVNYLLALLAYFAVRNTLGGNFGLVRGWVIGGVFVLAVFFLGLSVAPARLASPIFTNISGAELGTTGSGINRAALVVQIVLILGVFLGILYGLDRTKPIGQRLAGAVLFLLSVSSYVLMFLRGALLSIAIVTIVFMMTAGVHRKLRAFVLQLFVALALTGISAFVLYSLVLPEGIDYFSVSSGGLSSFVDEARVTQADRMLAAFAQQPVFGQGVGVPLPDYSRSGEAGLQFELQYHMLLYRFGLVSFGLVLLPVLWFWLQLFRVMRSGIAVVLHPEGKFMLAVLLTLLCIFIAGGFNPYLTAIYTPFLAVLYLACKELVLTPNVMSAARLQSPR